MVKLLEQEIEKYGSKKDSLISFVGVLRTSLRILTGLSSGSRDR